MRIVVAGEGVPPPTHPENKGFTARLCVKSSKQRYLLAKSCKQRGYARNLRVGSQSIATESKSGRSRSCQRTARGMEPEPGTVRDTNPFPHNAWFTRSPTRW